MKFTSNADGEADRVAPTLGLLPWGNVIEDFLDGIGLSIDAFCTEMTGGWLFGYVDALKWAGWRTVVFCTSARVQAPERRTHRDTGATICLLPASRSYRAVSSLMKNPYGWELHQVFGRAPTWARPVQTVLRSVAPYLATPLRSLARELRREGCAALLCQEYEYARFDACVRLGRRMRLPVFATFQGGDRPASRLEAWVRPWSIAAARGLIVPARSEAQRVTQVYRISDNKIGLIPNPIDLSRWPTIERGIARAALGLPIEARIAIYHGRIEMHRKGIDLLLEAWRRVVSERSGRDLRLIIVGSGRDADRLRRYLNGAPVPGLHWVAEYVTDRDIIRHYLCAADVYASASRQEGFPVALLEAMACAVPVVSTDAQGVPDILQDNEAAGGILVPRDDPIALAAALGRIIDDEAFARRLARAARRHVEMHFSMPAVGAQLSRFLTSHGAIAGTA
jgi:glycosyltransferase involved in cell wall biosynthesis